ncbi:GAF domain-containing protein, partial [Streptomyces sp. NPDC127049]|uniref:GAF domain-containing protein n=1 Tax=Streptomyces sp. NPDC127049 TaxID=3347118 RepID=UPI003667798F
MDTHGADGGADADTLLAVLELLAGQALPGQFEALLDEARIAGLDRAGLDRLERAVALARALHAERAADRVRADRDGASLAVLTDTARDLTLSYDLDGLLRIVTRRARRLLGLDMAYVTLRGPQGACYIRITEGSRTGGDTGGTGGPGLSVGMRIGSGNCLGGVVQRTGEPVWTPDYPVDERFTSGAAPDPAAALDDAEVVDPGDEAVRAEGLRAIVAVPLRSGDSVIGALVGAARRGRAAPPPVGARLGARGARGGRAR